MTEEEKMARMEHSENIAKEFFKSLIAKKNDSQRMVVADILHVGVVLSALMLDMASRSCDLRKDELLDQYIEAVANYVEEGAFEVVSLNIFYISHLFML